MYILSVSWGIRLIVSLHERLIQFQANFLISRTKHKLHKKHSFVSAHKQQQKLHLFLLSMDQKNSHHNFLVIILISLNDRIIRMKRTQRVSIRIPLRLPSSSPVPMMGGSTRPTGLAIPVRTPLWSRSPGNSWGCIRVRVLLIG